MKNLLIKIFDYKTCKTLAFINFMFALFLNTMVLYTYYHHNRIENIEGFVYIFVSNVAFVAFTVITIIRAIKEKREKILPAGEFIKRYYPLIIAVIGISVMAVLKFDTLPVYDANLYYGSFIQIYKLYKFTIASTIGAINVWNNVFIGTALFVSPFECFKVGEMTGTYIANTLLFAATLVILYRYLELSLAKSNKWILTFFVVAFAFMPYSFNLITYFCPDYYLELFFIWLLYAYKKDNQLMVSFIGFLLCFTKTSGALMYALFVFFAYVISNIISSKQTGEKWFLPKNWPIGKFVLWVVPAIIYFAVFITKDRFQLQVYEDQGTASYGLTYTDVTIQTLQNYVYGYRWAIILLGFVALAIYAVKKSRAKKSGAKLEAFTTADFTPQFLSLLIATIAFSSFLCIFTMSHCPRYTTVNNVALVLVLALSVSIITSEILVKQFVAFFFALLMFSQTYITTDPAIRYLCTPLDLGNHQVYNLVLNKLIDEDPKLPWLPDTLGDVYVYNEEYSVYDDLLNDTLKYYDPQEKSYVLVYEVDKYEIHPGGMHYWIYWNTNLKTQTYKKRKGNIKIRGGTIEDKYCKKVDYDEFYLLVPARADEKEAIKEFKRVGYYIDDSYVASSKYGYMDTYKLVLDDEHREIRDKKKAEEKKKKELEKQKEKLRAEKRAETRAKLKSPLANQAV